jgi:uncharacterized protein
MEKRAVTSMTATGRKLHGYAATFGTEARIGALRETIRPGAFKGSLKGRDVVALVDHDNAKLLARTRSGSLRLQEDDKGLSFELDLPDTQAGRDVLALAERGDLGGMSFGFTVPAGGEIREGNRRELREVVLARDQRSQCLARIRWNVRPGAGQAACSFTGREVHGDHPMKIFDRLFKREQRAATDPSWAALSGLNTASGHLVNPRLAENLSTVLGCVSSISSAIASLPAWVYRTNGRGRDVDESHPVARLILNGPNQYQTWPDWCEWLMAQVLLRGNAFPRS